MRTATAADLHSILALLQGCGLRGEDLTSDQLDTFLVLCEGGKLIGTAAVEIHGRDGLLRSVAVAPEYRSQGHAAALLNGVEAMARRRDVRTLYLLTETAAAYFSRSGYSPVERMDVPEAIRGSTQFASLCPASANCMRKSLGVAAAR